MRLILFLLLAIIYPNISMKAQSSSIDDPVYFGMMLVDQPNIGKMEEICEYYGLHEEAEDNSFRVFRYSNGNTLKFRTNTINSKYMPIIKITTNKSIKEIEQILNDAGYLKESDGYFKGTRFEHRRTKCNVEGGLRKTLTFEKVYNR